MKKSMSRIFRELRELEGTPVCRAIHFIKSNTVFFEGMRIWFEILNYMYRGSIEDEDFRYIRFRTYDRHKEPEYPAYSKDEFSDRRAYAAYCRYLTVATANEDIVEQKRQHCPFDTYELIAGKRSLFVRPCAKPPVRSFVM